ncbi:MAG TPA: hypothetical protein VF913_06695 [Xanthobacteraceae bacterium]
MIVFRDIETRSTISLKTVGAWRYAADPTTEVLCVGYAIDDGLVQIWVPGQPVPPEIIEAARDPNSTFVAHNDAFETAVEQLILGPRFGWPIVPIERHRCTMAAAWASALPGSLASAATALGLPVQKDAAGHRVMLRMTKPRKPRKGEDPNVVHWVEDDASIAIRDAYCMRDVEVCRALFRRLRPLIPSEQKLWALDATINARGFHDVALARAAQDLVRQEQAAIDAEISVLTGGEITTANQVKKITAFVRDRGHQIKGLTRRSVSAVLARGNPNDEIHRLLELRRDGGLASVHKLNALLAGVDRDGRLRGTLNFSAASTGRWSGAGFQPQNLKRPKTKDLEAAVDAILAGDIDRIRTLGAPLSVIGDTTRCLLCSAPGHTLVCGDFSSVESRTLAWLAGETWKLDIYRKFDLTGDPALEPYCVTASRVLRRPVTPADEAGRQTGKTADLALGYGGAIGAWRAFDDSDTHTDAEVERIKNAWRASHPATTRFWRRLEASLKKAIRTGERVELNRLAFEYADETAFIVLPSGRRLAYPGARLVPGKFGDGTTQVAFMDNARGGWAEVAGWHGTFTENVVSAISRDLLAAAMLRLDRAGFKIVLTVHDEVMVEVLSGSEDLAEFERLLTIAPAWASELPIACKVRSGHRYAKSSKPMPALEFVLEPEALEPEYADDF